MPLLESHQCPSKVFERLWKNRGDEQFQSVTIAFDTVETKLRRSQAGIVVRYMHILFPFQSIVSGYIFPKANIQGPY